MGRKVIKVRNRRLPVVVYLRLEALLGKIQSDELRNIHIIVNYHNFLLYCHIYSLNVAIVTPASPSPKAPGLKLSIYLVFLSLL